VITLPLRIAHLLPEAAVVRIFAIVSVFAAIAYATRWEIHLEGMLRQCEGRAHVGVIAIEGLVALALLAFGPMLLADPDAWIETGGAGVFVVVIVAMALWMSELVERTAVKSGTQLADHCWLISFLRTEVLWRLDHVPLARKIDGLFEREAPPGRVSYLVLWIVVGLLTVFAANASTTVPTAVRFLAGGGKVVHKVGGKSGHQTGQQSPDGAKSTTSTTGTKGSEPSDEQTTEEAPTPEYRQLCADDPVPGTPAPEPLRRLLYGQWLGEGGPGAIVAGCAQGAQRLANGEWYEVGRCEGVLRSLAFATEDTAGMVLWAPAQYAYAHALDGSLEGVTSGRLVGSGQMYTVNTSLGTAVFIRSRLAQETRSSRKPATGCSEYHEGVVPLVEIPPALARLWASFIETEHEWLWPTTPSPKEPSRVVFLPSKERDRRSIVGTCEGEAACRLRVGRSTSTSSGTGGIDLEALLEYAPPAP
jgi:hypothetical protein